MVTFAAWTAGGGLRQPSWRLFFLYGDISHFNALWDIIVSVPAHPGMGLSSTR